MRAMSDNLPRPRRALSGLQGGPITRSGDPTTSALLAAALDVVGGELVEHTHAFHSYPARFHPLLPRRLLEARPKARRVLDPFVGSGTTLVEAVVAGRRASGGDVNPLAVALARFKSTPADAHRRGLLAAAAAEVAAVSHEAVRAARRRSTPRAAPTERTRYDHPRFYPPHVFRELVGLREAIDAVAPAEGPKARTRDCLWLREALLLVLSSIVVKVSLQRSDTDETLVERMIARGAATRHFARRVDELIPRMQAFAEAVPRGTLAPDVRLVDARRLDHIAPLAIDLVITSPPYLGTYDYAAHHARRFGWLGFDTQTLQEAEIGARRSSLTQPPAGAPRPGRRGPLAQTFTPEEAEVAAIARWADDVKAFVGEIARVLADGGEAFLLVGDSTLGTRAIRGDEELRRAAAAHGLHVVAGASQARPEVYAPTQGQLDAGKREHLIALQKR